jgi:membrane protease YdiL (CAAX protease family)
VLFNDKKLNQAALFYALSFGQAVALALAAPHFGRGVLLMTMFTPAVSVVVCRMVSPEGARFRFSELGLARLGLRYWPVAMFLPVVALLPGYLLVWGTGIGGIAAPPGDASLLQAVVSFVASIIIGSVLGALGEEIGWRGYLLPRLVDTVGTGRAGLLSGFLHGLWHVPLILLTPYYLSDAPALLVVPLFLVLVTLSGPIFAYLRLASGSILPVALMHNTWNDVWTMLDDVTTSSNDAFVAYLSGESGIVSILMLAAICLWLTRRGQSDRSLAGVA